MTRWLLCRKIKRFYKDYWCVLGHTHNVNMHDQDSLMTVYEDMWTVMDYLDEYDDYQWVCRLYCELGDYMQHPPMYQSMTMGNIVPSFKEVIAQVWESLTVYHTLDIKWKRC